MKTLTARYKNRELAKRGSLSSEELPRFALRRTNIIFHRDESHIALYT